jgi:hypothetical protein
MFELLACAVAIQQSATDAEAKEALRTFEVAWRGAKEDGAREGAITVLRHATHAKLLEKLVEVGRGASPKVRAVCAQGLGQYYQTPKAAEVLVGWLNGTDTGADVVTLNIRVFESLSSFDCAIARRHAASVHAFFKHRDTSVAKAAVAAAGAIRHRDSIDPLLEEWEQCRKRLVGRFLQHNIQGCDGG